MSTATTSIHSYHLEKLRLSTRNRSHSCAPWISTARQHIHSLGLSRRGQENRIISMDLNAVNNLPEPPIPSGGSPFPGWSNWMLLAIIPIIIPFLTNKWGALIALKQKFDTTLDKLGSIAETIEDVAEGVDQLADDVSEKLPEGSRLRKIVERIDRVAEETVKGADRAEELLQKVDDIGDKVEAVIKQSVEDNVSLKKQLEVATTDAESLKKQLDEATTKADDDK